MSFPILYPGIAFSPQAFLSQNIGAADTILPVTDINAFPPAPNLATIGTDEDGETVLYTAKTETALSGCTRAVEGTARPWQAGEPVARNFTAKDHDDFILSVKDAKEAAETAQDAAETAKDAADTAQETANGKLAPEGDASDTIAQFTAPASRSLPTSGEKLGALFGKIARYLTDLKAVAFSGNYSDLSGTVGRLGSNTGAEIFNHYGGNLATGQYSHAESQYVVAAAKYASHAKGATCIVADKSQIFRIASCDAANQRFVFDVDFDGFADAFSHLAVGTKLFVTNEYYIGDAKQFTIAGIDSDNNAVTVSETIPSSNFTPKYAVNISYTAQNGYCSYAEGDRTLSIGDYSSHAEGRQTVSSGNQSHAEGGQSVASGDQAHAEGYKSIASGGGAHAEGRNTQASGSGDHAEGNSCIANGFGTHAEGFLTIAEDTASHAGGSNCKALAMDSFAMGYFAVADKPISTAIGSSVTASAQCQFVIGSHNKISTSSGDRFIIGKGDSEDSRANCFRVTKTGVYATGEFSSTGADYAEWFEWADGNPDGADRVGRFVTLEGEKIRLCVPGDGYILGVVSGAPSVAGDSYDDQWRGMYQTDIYGRPVWETREVPAEIGPDGETLCPARVETVEALNPDYDSSQPYLPRSKRKEWSAVGLLGKLVVDDDGSCLPDGWCTPGENGIAVRSESRTKFRVLSRLDANHIRILIL